MSTDLEIIRQKITDLYRYRDEYFLKINENEWPQKQAAIEIKIKVICDELEKHSDDVDKAEYYFLKGWLLNIRDQYDSNVFETLTKSIKFRPDNQQAWLELG
ncbi:Tetratricopeptide repeat protein 5 [Dermatophagoides farinae]|nr:Tetratricopeptide repeat protein 5 [Dermatophagoides farinae]